MAQSPLAGKTALVTGAASGVGRAVARRYAERDVQVIAFDVAARGLEELVSERPGIIPVVGDVRDRSALEKAVEGRDPHIVAAIAGISRVGSLLDMDDDQRDLIWAVNLAGVWNTVKAALPGLLRNGPGGRVLVCGSIESVLGGEGLSAYVASKHAVLGLAKSAALELATSGITVNVISPAGVDSEMLRTVVPPEGIEHIAATTPIPRLSSPDEVAAFFEFLAGPNTSYMTGENIMVDGGLKLVNAHSQGQVWTRPVAGAATATGS